MARDDGERRPTPIRRKAHTTTASDPHGSGPRRDPSSRPFPATPPVSLLDEQLDPEFRLKQVLDMSRRAYEEYQEACIVADDYGVGRMPDGTNESDLTEIRERIRNEVRKKYNRWFELTAQARSVESEVRRIKVERDVTSTYAQDVEEIRDALVQEYEGLGAHYDLLCANCASLTVKLRRMETSGRDYESGEYTELHKLYLSYINQLQKYTEAMKTESINRQTQEVAERLIQVFERHFGMTHPDEWNSAVKEIREAIEGAA